MPPQAVYNEFANGDPHAAILVAQPQNALAIGHDNDFDIIAGKSLQHFVNLVTVGREINKPRPRRYISEKCSHASPTVGV